MTVKEKQKYHERWDMPGIPWQVECFSVLLLLVSVFLPAFLPEHRQVVLGSIPWAESGTQTTITVWSQGHGYLWTLLIFGAYFLHWITAYISPDFISTPFAYMFSPVIFGSLAYGRLLMWSRVFPENLQLVRGTFAEALVWLLAIHLITLLLARLRMHAHLGKFSDVQWDLDLKPRREGRAVIQLILKVHPLYYWPVRYKACGEGILILGVNYIMPIPFAAIESVSAAPRGSTITTSFFLATSMTSLLRIQLYDRLDAVFISPRHPNLMQQYCLQIMADRLPVVERHLLPNGPMTPYGEPEHSGEEDNPYYNI